MNTFLVFYYDINDKNMDIIKRVFDDIVKRLGNDFDMPIVALPNTTSIATLSHEDLYKYWESLGLNIGALKRVAETENKDASSEKNNENNK